MSKPASVLCQIQDRVARITLNRPPLNILDIPMIGELHEALARVQSASDANVLLIAHLGKAFSAGVSIQDHAPDKVGEMLKKFHGISVCSIRWLYPLSRWSTEWRSAAAVNSPWFAIGSWPRIGP